METEKSPLVLVVDDSVVNIQLLENILTKEGYRVATATSGAQAREVAALEPPALILLDIRMPEEDGFEVLKSLKRNPKTAAVPVIFVTGVSDIDTKLSGFNLGAVDYVIKPFHPGEVVARVRLHLKLSIATNSMLACQADRLKQLSDAQTALLPLPAHFPDANFGVFYSALQEAGGDFYDVLPVSTGIYGYCVADFSGHDIKTSYLTAALKALLRQNTSPVYQPEETIKMINDVLVAIIPEDIFVTACYARLNRAARRITIVNAGNPPVIHLPQNGRATPLEIEGDVLGAFNTVRLGRIQIDVNPGDRFYLYSDGLVELACTTDNRSACIENLVDVCEQMAGIPITEAPEQIVHAMLHNASVRDDVVVLGVQV